MHKLNYVATLMLSAISVSAFALDETALRTLNAGQSAFALDLPSEGLASEPGASSNPSAAEVLAAYFGLRPVAVSPLGLGNQSSRFSVSYWGLGETASREGYDAGFENGAVLRLSRINQSAAAPMSIYGVVAEFADRSLVTLEVQKTLVGVSGAITLGQFRQTASALGSTGPDLARMLGRQSTSFLSLAGMAALSEKLRVAAMMTLGHGVDYELSQASQLRAGSPARTGDLSLGLVQRDALKEGDRLGFTIALPFNSGSGFQQESATGIEKNFEVSYASALLSGDMTAMAQIKLQSGNDAQSTPRFGIGLRYSYAFK